MYKMMKITLNKLIRNEKGYALPIVLVLLLIGGIIIGPLLGFMSTGVMAGQVNERMMERLYAADAGIEKALWNIKYDTSLVPDEGGTADFALTLPINDRTVDVSIFCFKKTVAGGTYKITSVATSAGGSSSTTIEVWVKNLPLFWDNAVTSTSGIELQPGTEVNGDVSGNVTGGGTVNGENSPPYGSNEWPFSEDFRPFYWPYVADPANVLDPDPTPYNVAPGIFPLATDTIDVKSTPNFGQSYSDGDLTIESTENTFEVTANLTGTVYVKGDDSTLHIGKTKQSFILNLNNQTIYVEGKNFDLSQPTKYAIDIGNQTKITGSGIIIAEGNINFQPNMEAGSEDDFVFVMSIFGRVNVKPNGTLYGSVAAQEVYLAPGNILTHTNPDVDLLNFPVADVQSAQHIRTWIITP